MSTLANAIQLIDYIIDRITGGTIDHTTDRNTLNRNILNRNTLNRNALNHNALNRNTLTGRGSIGRLLLSALFLFGLQGLLFSKELSSAEVDEFTYNELNRRIVQQESGEFIEQLKKSSQSIDWRQVREERQFRGYLRFMERGKSGDGIYLLRSTTGEVFVLTRQHSELTFDPQELQKMTRYKMDFKVKTVVKEVANLQLKFSSFSAQPDRPLIDRIFYMFIIILLFTVMLGMGLTLTIENFQHILKKPKAMLIGPLCQIGLLPFLAMLFGSYSGIREAHPFVYVGLILVAASPGGVTSNILTYWGRGDLALSISMTAFSTMLSIVFTPLLLYLYTSQVSDVDLPIKDIVLQIFVLVLVPLFLGMFIRNRAENFARRSEKFFSLLGLSALLILITAGLLNNPEVLVDFERYGLRFYAVIFSLTLSAMLFSLLIAKLLKITNYQTRAISLETGIQNAGLAITIAFLIQDKIGDFYSSTVFTSGLYGIWMYLAGGIMIAAFRKILPVKSINSKSG